MLAFRLAAMLWQFVLPHRLGTVTTETLFRLGPDLPQRRPDAAFVSAARWPMDREIPVNDPWDVVPDLAIEVVSPSNSAQEVIDKLGDYFAAGVRRERNRRHA